MLQLVPRCNTLAASWWCTVDELCTVLRRSNNILLRLCCAQVEQAYCAKLLVEHMRVQDDESTAEISAIDFAASAASMGVLSAQAMPPVAMHGATQHDPLQPERRCNAARPVATRTTRYGARHVVRSCWWTKPQYSSAGYS